MNKEKINRNSQFEKVFSYLKKFGDIAPSAKKTYELLKEFSLETSNVQSDILISELNKIQYASNTNSFFISIFQWSVIFYITNLNTKKTY